MTFQVSSLIIKFLSLQDQLSVFKAKAPLSVIKIMENRTFLQNIDYRTQLCKGLVTFSSKKIVTLIFYLCCDPC